MDNNVVDVGQWKNMHKNINPLNIYLMHRYSLDEMEHIFHL